MLSSGANVDITTELAGTNYDSIPYIRGVCESVATEVGCDDVDDTFTVALGPGTYFVIVDSHTINQEGDFELLVSW